MSETSDFEKRVDALQIDVEARIALERETHIKEREERARLEEEARVRQAQIQALLTARQVRNRALIGTNPNEVLGEGTDKVVNAFLGHMARKPTPYPNAHLLVNFYDLVEKRRKVIGQTPNRSVAGYCIGVAISNSKESADTDMLAVTQPELFLCTDGLLRIAVDEYTSPHRIGEDLPLDENGNRAPLLIGLFGKRGEFIEKGDGERFESPYGTRVRTITETPLESVLIHIAAHNGEGHYVLPYSGRSQMSGSGLGILGLGKGVGWGGKHE